MAELNELRHENELLKAENEKLKHLNEYYLSLLQNKAQKKYGSSSEATESMQISLFNESEAESDDTVEEPFATEVILYKRRKRKGIKQMTYQSSRLRLLSTILTIMCVPNMVAKTSKLSPKQLKK